MTRVWLSAYALFIDVRTVGTPVVASTCVPLCWGGTLNQFKKKKKKKKST